MDTADQKAAQPVDALSPLEIAERDTVVFHLTATGWNQAQAARILQIRPNTLIIKIRKYGLQRPAGIKKGRPSAKAPAIIEAKPSPFERILSFFKRAA